MNSKHWEIGNVYRLSYDTYLSTAKKVDVACLTNDLVLMLDSSETDYEVQSWEGNLSGDEEHLQEAIFIHPKHGLISLLVSDNSPGWKLLLQKV